MCYNTRNGFGEPDPYEKYILRPLFQGFWSYTQYGSNRQRPETLKEGFLL